VTRTIPAVGTSYQTLLVIGKPAEVCTALAGIGVEAWPLSVSTSLLLVELGSVQSRTCEYRVIWTTRAKHTITVAFKKPKGGHRTATEKTFDKAHNGVRAIGERGNSPMKTTFKVLRDVSLSPWSIGKIATADLVLLHIGHVRTT
jgi:hypothetical protein